MRHRSWFATRTPIKVDMSRFNPSHVAQHDVYAGQKINLVRLLTTILVEKIFQFLVQGTISILYDIRELFVSKFLP